MNRKIYITDLTHTGNGTMALTFPLGASYVASYAKKILGEKFDFKLFKYQDRLHQAILNDSPFVLGISNYCWNIELGYTLIKWAKNLNPNLIAIMGGPNFPTETDDKIEFLRFFSKGGTKNEYFAEYMEDLYTQMTLKYPHNLLVFLMDNLSAHKNIRIMKIM